MIERAFGCLENRARNLLRLPKKPIRSRRCLHSAFWSHGAGNIDLPSWWIFLLQTPEPENESSSTRKSRSGTASMTTNLQDIFLDFLYPVQTLALIRRLKRSATAYQYAAQIAKNRSRNYTSIATDFLNRANGVFTDERMVTQKISTRTESFSSQAEDFTRGRIDELLGSPDPERSYDELWRKYQDLLQASGQLSHEKIIKLLRYLGTSERKIDAERLLGLFKSISTEERKAIHYSHAISAALSLKDVNTAMEIHGEARPRVRYVGTSDILRYAIEHELWKEAVEIFHIHWNNKIIFSSRPYIWFGIEALPLSDLIGRAASAADYAVSLAESEYPGAYNAACDFALEFTKRIFCFRGVTVDAGRIMGLLRKFESARIHRTAMAEAALLHLLSGHSPEHGQGALHIYRWLRQDPKFSPRAGLLARILNNTHLILSPKELLHIIQDWRKCAGQVPKHAFERVTKKLAGHGQVEAVEDLFNQFCTSYGKPDNSRFYNYMLYVHFRRADNERITSTFNRLQAEYNFKPNVTSFNFLIAAFARVGDVDGTLHWFQKLREMGLKPNSRTFSTLMSMYAHRGDREAVSDVYHQSQDEGVKPIMPMMDTLVLAQVNDDKIREAEKLANDALHMDLEGSRTHMWNIILNTYALRKELEKVSEVHKHMQESGVPSDHLTYAALMTSLTRMRLPFAARRIMKRVLPRLNIKPTALHYAILMSGYLLTKEYHKVFREYQDMVQNNLAPDVGTRNALLRAAVAVDKAQGSQDEGQNDQEQFTRATQTLELIIENLDPAELAPSGPRKFVGANPINETFTSTYFEYMIFLYGTNSAFTKVSELYNRYIQTAQKFRNQDVEASPPIRMLTALMVAHKRAGNHEEVDRCWYMSLEKAEKLSRSAKSKKEKVNENWVLHARRFIMDIPLEQYITHLGDQGRHGDTTNVVNDLHYAGYALTNRTWNTYIRLLAQSSNSQHQILAFELCEKELIHDWPGWESLGVTAYIKRKLNLKHKDLMFQPFKRLPKYSTFVHLAAVYMDTDRRGRERERAHLSQVAPRTADAVRNMPRLDDWEQMTFLRKDDY